MLEADAEALSLRKPLEFRVEVQGLPDVRSG
jgi:hypothetical protein